MPRSPSRNARSTGRAGRTFAGSSGGGGGTPLDGPTLLKAYVTPVGTDEATPRTVTFDTPSTPGRNLYAFNAGTGALSLPSPWTLAASAPAGTVAQLWTVSKAGNTGLSSVVVTSPYAPTAYPFTLTVFEDDVATQQVLSGPTNTGPSGGTWSSSSQSITAGWRTIAMFAALTYQSAPGAEISAYNNGLVEFSDSGVSSVYNNAHVAWYSGRQWMAWSDSISGTATLTATATSTNTGTGWVCVLAYSKG